MKTKQEVLERLRDGTQKSTNYISYLTDLVRHFEKYGERPKLKHLGKSYTDKNKPLWLGGQTKHGRDPLIENAEIIIKDNKVYEIMNAELYEAQCTAEEYLKYKKPTPYAIYITS